MSRLGRVLVMVLVLTVAGALVQPVQVLSVNVDGDGSIVCRRLGRGEPVTLVFTHSMYGGEVRETWRVDGDALTRERIVTDNAAAAEYYATDGKTRRVDDGYEVISPPLREDALVIRVDQIGRHRLRVDSGEVSLADAVDGSAAVTMRVRQEPLIARIIDDGAGCNP